MICPCAFSFFVHYIPDFQVHFARFSIHYFLPYFCVVFPTFSRYTTNFKGTLAPVPISTHPTVQCTSFKYLWFKSPESCLAQHFKMIGRLNLLPGREFKLFLSLFYAVLRSRIIFMQLRLRVKLLMRLRLRRLRLRRLRLLPCCVARQNF
jgi:hypothetical protein